MPKRMTKWMTRAQSGCGYYGLTYAEIQRVYSLNKIPLFKMTLSAYKNNVGIHNNVNMGSQHDNDNGDMP